MARTASKVTTDHDEIRRWAEERGARPAAVKRTKRGGEVGIIRLDFPGFTGEQSLQEISWDEWLQNFDKNNLALVYQDRTAAGRKSNFNKLVARETVAERGRGSRARKEEAEAPAVSMRLREGEERPARAERAGSRTTSVAAPSRRPARGERAGTRPSAAARKTGAGKAGARKTGARAKAAGGAAARGKKAEPEQAGRRPARGSSRK